MKKKLFTFIILSISFLSSPTILQGMKKRLGGDDKLVKLFDINSSNILQGMKNRLGDESNNDKHFLSKLFEVASRGDLEGFTRLCGKNGKIGGLMRIESGNKAAYFAPLCLAVFAGNLKIVKYLVEECNIPINLSRDKSLPPLFSAIKLKKFDIFKYLLSKGASIKINDAEGYYLTNILMYSIHYNNLDCVKHIVNNQKYKSLLNESIKEGGYTPLLLAVLEGNVGILKVLLKTKGININRTVTKKVAGTGMNFLELAVWLGKFRCVGYILHKFPQLLKSEKSDLLGLAIQGKEESSKIIKFLVGKGADINYEDEDRNTYLHVAVEKKQFDIVKYLVEKGYELGARFNIYSSNKEGVMPFCMKSSSEIESYLYEKHKKAFETQLLMYGIRLKGVDSALKINVENVEKNPIEDARLNYLLSTITDNPKKILDDFEKGKDNSIYKSQFKELRFMHECGNRECLLYRKSNNSHRSPFEVEFAKRMDKLSAGENKKKICYASLGSGGLFQDLRTLVLFLQNKKDLLLKDNEEKYELIVHLIDNYYRKQINDRIGASWMVKQGIPSKSIFYIVVNLIHFLEQAFKISVTVYMHADVDDYLCACKLNPEVKAHCVSVCDIKENDFNCIMKAEKDIKKIKKAILPGGFLGTLDVEPKIIHKGIDERSFTILKSSGKVVKDFKYIYKCLACNKISVAKMRVCSRCRKANYCSRDCQKKDWKRHRNICKKIHAGLSVLKNNENKEKRKMEEDRNENVSKEKKLTFSSVKKRKIIGQVIGAI